MDTKRTTPRLIITKMSKVKDKERILKAAREKQLVMYKGAHLRLSADFSTDSLQDRREWHEIFKVLKSKELQPKLLHSADITGIEGEIKSFTDNKKQKELLPLNQYYRKC